MENKYEVRFPREMYKGRGEKSYRFDVDGNVIFLPVASVELRENGKFIDVDMPKWMAVKNKLSGLVISEF